MEVQPPQEVNSAVISKLKTVVKTATLAMSDYNLPLEIVAGQAGDGASLIVIWAVKSSKARATFLVTIALGWGVAWGCRVPGLMGGLRGLMGRTGVSGFARLATLNTPVPVPTSGALRRGRVARGRLTGHTARLLRVPVPIRRGAALVPDEGVVTPQN